jgi:hypothetical protein
LIFAGSYLVATEAGIEIGTVYRVFARFRTCYLPAVIWLPQKRGLQLLIIPIYFVQKQNISNNKHTFSFSLYTLNEEIHDLRCFQSSVQIRARETQIRTRETDETISTPLVSMN